MCGQTLRPATLAEIRADMNDADPQRKQQAQLSKQGRWDLETPEDLPDWIKLQSETESPSWQFRCDGCGHVLVSFPAKRTDE